MVHKHRRSILYACLAAFFLALSAGAAELPPAVYVSGASPKRLLKTFDTLVTTFLKDTDQADKYEPGSAPDRMRQIGLPAVFDNDDAAIGFAVDVDENLRPQWAFTLFRVDFNELCAQLKQAGFPTNFMGETATVKGLFPNQTIFLRTAAPSIVVAGFDPYEVKDLAGKFADGVPLHPPGTDLAVVALPIVLRQRFTGQIDMVRTLLASEATLKEIADAMPSSFDDTLRSSLATTIRAYCLGLFDRIREIDRAESTLTVDGDALVLTGTLVPNRDGAWAALAKKYDGAAEPAYRLEGAVPEGALFFSAETRPDDGLLPGGFAFNAMFDVLGNMFGHRRAEMEKIRADLTGNGRRERIGAFRLTDDGPRQVTLASLDDGRKQAASWVELAEMCNRIARDMKAKGDILSIEKGTVGQAAYHRISLTGGNQPKTPVPRTSVESQVRQGFGALLGGGETPNAAADPNAFSTVMGANKSTFVSVSGKNVAAIELLEQIQRTGKRDGGSFIASAAVRLLLPKLTPRQMSHGMAKPTDLTSALVKAIFAETDPHRVAEAAAVPRETGDLVGWSLGVHFGDIRATAIIPLSVINDFTVNVTRLNEAGLFDTGGSSGGKAADTPPSPSPTMWDDDDDWGWGGGETPPSAQPSDDDGTVSDLRRKALAGDHTAQFDLGLAYASGNFGLTVDAAEAAKWYRMAADQGELVAMNNLGVLYIENLDRPEEGFRWILQAAEKGYVLSARVAGIYYREGTGVAKNIPEAIRWLQLAADQGDGSACLNLGVLYNEGDDGLTRDFAKALDYFRQGDELGFAPCTRNLGVLLETGGDGVPADPAQALALYIHAGNAGDPTSMYYAGLNYRDGLGTEKNLAWARHWFQRAADAGYDKAKEELAKIPAGTVPEAE